MTQEENDGGSLNKIVEVVEVFEVAPRDYPITHTPVDAPLCEKCKGMELVFLDPNCPSCRENIVSSTTTIGEIFAVMRQWIPPTQHNIEFLINEIQKKGAHVDDRDGLTDMTLLHFACKAGAVGVGDAETSSRVVSSLLKKDANVNLCCRWTKMTALHYSAYFGVAPVLRLLLAANKGVDVNQSCLEFENGTALHIAASNLCLDAVSVLLEFNANPTARDDLGRTPSECVPDPSSFPLIPDVVDIIDNIKQMLQNAEAGVLSKEPVLESISGRALLKSMGLKLGDRVSVGSNKIGILRYCGTTEFATGIWAGVELDQANGKNDGSVKGVKYFKCPPNYGIFAPINKLSRVSSPSVSRKASSRGSPSRTITYPKMDLSHVTSKIETGLSPSKMRQKSPSSDLGTLDVGERVIVAGKRKGTIKFSGETHFASGWWYGIELDSPEGKNDGSVKGISYFTCKPNHGVFAPASRLTKLTAISDEYLSDFGSSTEGPSGGTLSLSSRSTPDRDISKSSSLTRHGSLRSPHKPRNSRLRNSFRKPNSSDTLRGETWLSEGMNVLISNEIGTVKYIGAVDFADGTWIGIELKSPKGKNDGTIQGKRYFTCKPEHGLMVRPNKVTVHGISGAKLLTKS